jgi:hypothetical protein
MSVFVFGEDRTTFQPYASGHFVRAITELWLSGSVSAEVTEGDTPFGDRKSFAEGSAISSERCISLGVLTNRISCTPA